MNKHLPNLGLATTRELFDELIARFVVTGGQGNLDRSKTLEEMKKELSDKDLSYTTVGG